MKFQDQNKALCRFPRVITPIIKQDNKKTLKK